MAKLKLKGSTLVEVLVAMTIILTCLGIAMMIFTNLSRDVNDELRILAEVRINTVAAETKIKMDFTETDVEFENMIIHRSILPFPQKERIRILFLQAFTPQEKKIAEYREMIIVENTANAKP